jgi:CheY-like chemotaxis protein
MRKKILSVGNCSFDHGKLARFMSQHFHAEVFAARHTEEAFQRLRAERFDLVLVNRIFHGSGHEGLETIRSIKADPELAATPVMLLSNYAEYQAQALAAGAEIGFGKEQLESQETLENLRQVLAPPDSVMA